MSRFSFWRAVRIAAVAVLAAAALFLALQVPAQPSAQAVNTCRMTDVTGTLTVNRNGVKSSVPINYGAWLIPGQTSQKAFTGTVSDVTGKLTISIRHPTVDTVSASAVITVNNSSTGAGSQSSTQVTSLPVGSSTTRTVYASVWDGPGSATATFTVYARGMCPT